MLLLSVTSGLNKFHPKRKSLPCLSAVLSVVAGSFVALAKKDSEDGRIAKFLLQIRTLVDIVLRIPLCTMSLNGESVQAIRKT